MTLDNFSTKICTNCKVEKAVFEFHKDKSEKDGLCYICRACHSERNAAYYKTKKGVITRLYGGQRSNSKKRGHAMPDYTKAMLLIGYSLNQGFTSYMIYGKNRVI